MGVGDPWDTSYDPKRKNKRNKTSQKISWGPDLSDEYPWEDKEDYKGYGRFCAEGCGCINTGCDNGFTGAQCILPNELTITLIKDENGRVSARGGLESRGDVWHLRYSNGAWRGRKCCTKPSDLAITENATNRATLSPRLWGPTITATAKQALTEGAEKPHPENAVSIPMIVPPACDPCKVTTLPNGKQSECWYKSNRYYGDLQPDKKNPSKRQTQSQKTKWSYDAASQGEDTWPRQGEELYLSLTEWGSSHNIDATTDVDFKTTPAVLDEDGNVVTPQQVVVTSTDISRHGLDSSMGFNIQSIYDAGSLIGHNEDGDFTA